MKLLPPPSLCFAPNWLFIHPALFFAARPGYPLSRFNRMKLTSGISIKWVILSVLDIWEGDAIWWCDMIWWYGRPVSIIQPIIGWSEVHIEAGCLGVAQTDRFRSDQWELGLNCITIRRSNFYDQQDRKNIYLVRRENKTFDKHLHCLNHSHTQPEANASSNLRRKRTSPEAR